MSLKTLPCLFNFKFNYIKMKTKKAKRVVKDRTYRLISKSAPLSFTIASRNSKRFPLLWYDEENNINRPLRYAVNQKTPFEDEQDGHAIIEPVTFERGLLYVPKNNPVLQEFLHYHPQNGVLFEEIDNEADAQKQIDFLNIEVDALIKAKSLSIDELETVSRVLFNKDASNTSTSELKRDILIYARNYPHDFMDALDDPMLELQSKVHVFFDRGLLTFRKGNKEVWYSTPSNKKKMLNVPYGEDPYLLVSSYLKTDDGIESLKMLEHHMGE